MLLVLCLIYGSLAAAVAVMIVRHRRFGVTFPPLDSSRVLYRERWASACSHQTFLKRLGSANNCVSVVVTDEEVRVWLPFPLAILGYELDLEHRIPRRSIVGLQEWPHWYGPTWLLDYLDDEGRTRRIELALHRPVDFLKALNTKADPAA